MSKMISARVPDAVFEQASIQLESLGASTSDLVNAAFEYVLSERSLPVVPKKVKANKRVLTEKMRKELTSLFKGCTLGVSTPADVSHDKEIIRKSRTAKYEALS